MKHPAPAALTTAGATKLELIDVVAMIGVAMLVWSLWPLVSRRAWVGIAGAGLLGVALLVVLGRDREDRPKP